MKCYLLLKLAVYILKTNDVMSKVCIFSHDKSVFDLIFETMSDVQICSERHHLCLFFITYLKL